MINFPDQNNYPDENSKSGSDNRLRKSSKDKIIFGVCGGIGEKLGVNPVFVRFFFSILLIWGGAGILLYAPLSVIMKSGSFSKRKKAGTDKFYGFILLSLGAYFLFSGTFLFDMINIFQIPPSVINLLIPFMLSAVFFVKRNELFDSHGYGKESFVISRSDRRFFGVCGGFAAYLNVNSNFIRMLCMIFSFATAGLGIIIYLTVYFFIRDEDVSENS